MNLPEILTSLQRVLPQTEFPNVIHALRYDSLTWDSLQDNIAFHGFLKYAGHAASLWTPASLGLFELLGNKITAADLSSVPLIPLEESLKNRVVSVYEQYLVDPICPDTLQSAVLLALALRERLRLLGTWDGLLTELVEKQGLPDAQIFNIWKTPFSCLYGLIPDSDQMMRYLISGKDSSLELGVMMVTHIVLSNPANLDDKAEKFLGYMQKIPAAGRMNWLRDLNLRGETELSRLVAEKLLAEKEENIQSFRQSPHERDIDQSFNAALEMQEDAILNFLIGRPEIAKLMLNEARQIVQYWLAGLSIQMASVADDETTTDEVATEFSQYLQLVPDVKRLKDELFLAADVDVSKIEKIDIPNTNADVSWSMITKAFAMSRQGKTNQARDLARQAVINLVAEIKKGNKILQSHFLLGWQPASIIRKLIDLDLPSEAWQLCTEILNRRQADPELVNLAADLAYQFGDTSEAIQYAQLSTLLCPKNPESFRKLADLWEECGDWERTFESRQQVLRLIEKPEIHDWWSFARSAHHLNQNSLAIDTCKVILDLDENHGEAHALRGKTLAINGNWEEATTHLLRATELQPKDLTSWLYLSDSFLRDGNVTRSLETLRFAASNLPDSSEVNRRLAQLCKDNGLYSEALHYSRIASALSPDDLGIAIQLGDILFSIGYFGEARDVLHDFMADHANDPDLAYIYSKILLASNSDEDVTPLLECAIQKMPPEVERFIVYARHLIGDEELALRENPIFNLERIEKAQYALEKCLDLQPKNYEALLMLCEVNKLKGNFQTSFQLYKKLGESQSIERENLRHRIGAGLGQVALQLGNIETALVALKESVQAQPKNVYLNKLLAEACQKSGLQDDTYEYACIVRELNPDDEGNLEWFIDKTTSLFRYDDAISALRKLSQLQEDNIGYIIRIAVLELAKADKESARKTLEEIVNKDELSAEIYYQISDLFQNAGDKSKALFCLENAYKRLEGPNRRKVIVELISFLKNLNELERCLDYLDKAVVEFDDDLSLRILLVDLLADSNRPDDALRCLEEAVKLFQSDPSSLTSYKWNGNDGKRNLKDCFEKKSDPAGIYYRLAVLFRCLKNLELAYHYAVKAYEIESSSLETCFLVADLKHSLVLDNELSVSSGLNAHRLSSDASDVILGLNLLKIDQAFLRDELGDVEDCLKIGFDKNPNHPGLVSAKVRLLARAYRFDDARALFSQILSTYREKSEQLANQDFKWGYDRDNEISKKWRRWLAEAALEVGYWDEAIILFEEHKSRNMHEPEALVAYARCLVLCAEKEKLYSTIKCTHSKPGVDKIGQISYRKFCDVMEALENISKAGEIGRWRARGNMVFDPTTQHVKELYQVQTCAEDAGALVMGLRTINQGSKAIKAAHRYLDDPEVLIQMALCYQDNTRQLILDYATQAVERSPENPVYLAVFACAAEKNGNIENALAAIEKALLVFPEEPEWHAWAAKMNEETGFINKCIEHLEKAVTLDPDFPGYKMALGEALLESGNAERAIPLLKLVIDRNERNPQKLITLGKAYRMAGQLENAFESCERISHIEADAKHLLFCAEVALEMEKPNLALEYARKAYERDSKDNEILLFIIRVLNQSGRKNDALELMEKTNVSNSLLLMVEKAKLYQSVRGPKDTVPVLKEIIEQYPDNFEALEMLANSLFDIGRSDEAAKVAFNALRLNPGHPGLNQLLGKIHRQTGQLDQAIHFLSEAIRQNPLDIDVYLKLGEVYQERREYSKALSVYQQAYIKVPGDPRPYYEAAMILKDSKDYAGAERLLRKAADLAPDDLEIRRQLAPLVAVNLMQNTREVRFSL